MPQRDLRNRTAEMLRRVERGESLRVTVHGRPVADLVPLAPDRAFVSAEEVKAGLAGLLTTTEAEALASDIRESDAFAADPFGEGR